jgi:hypothetical protein
MWCINSTHKTESFSSCQTLLDFRRLLSPWMLAYKSPSFQPRQTKSVTLHNSNISLSPSPDRLFPRSSQLARQESGHSSCRVKLGLFLSIKILIQSDTRTKTKSANKQIRCLRFLLSSRPLPVFFLSFSSPLYRAHLVSLQSVHPSHPSDHLLR